MYRIIKTNVMNSLSPRISINSITYDTYDSNVLIQAVQEKNHLSFETTFMISFTELNLVINELQKLNPDEVISDLFVEEKLSQDFTQYFLNSRNLANRTVTMNQYLLDSTKKQIRA